MDYSKYFTGALSWVRTIKNRLISYLDRTLPEIEQPRVWLTMPMLSDAYKRRHIEGYPEIFEKKEGLEEKV